MNNKIDDLARAIERGDANAALRICCSMKDLGSEDEAIRLARSCLHSPAIYREMGYDTEARIADGFLGCQRVLVRLK
jgi:hypothetical protein